MLVNHKSCVLLPNSNYPLFLSSWVIIQPTTPGHFMEERTSIGPPIL